MNQINYTQFFGRQSDTFKDSAEGRRERRDRIRDLLIEQRDEAAETLSDMR